METTYEVTEEQLSEALAVYFEHETERIQSMGRILRDGAERCEFERILTDTRLRLRRERLAPEN